MDNTVLRVGADPFPPYQYADDDGSFHGSDYEHVKRVVEAMGLRMELTIKEWSEIQAMVDSGDLDAAFQVQKTPEREAKYAFSGLLRNAETQVITARGDLALDAIPQVPEKGLIIGLIEGYVNSGEIDALPDACKRTFPGTLALLKGIPAGEADIGVFDKGVKEYLMEQNGITGIRAIDNLTFLRPLHVIFRDAAVRDQFDRALSADAAAGN